MEEKILIKGKKTSPILYIGMNIFIIAILVFAYKNITRSLSGMMFLGVLIIVVTLMFLVCFFLTLLPNITVTDTKVYGCTSKYTKVVIPVATIKSVSLVNDYFLVIKTLESEFVYEFKGFTNAKEIVATINQLILKNKEISES